jgi:hypothetical protein
MNFLERIGLGTVLIAAIGIGVGGFAFGLKGIRDSVYESQERYYVSTVLDTDRNGKVDSEEFKPFAEITGTNAPSFDLASIYDVRKFLGSYNLK